MKKVPSTSVTTAATAKSPFQDQLFTFIGAGIAASALVVGYATGNPEAGVAASVQIMTATVALRGILRRARETGAG